MGAAAALRAHQPGCSVPWDKSNSGAEPWSRAGGLWGLRGWTGQEQAELSPSHPLTRVSPRPVPQSSVPRRSGSALGTNTSARKLDFLRFFFFQNQSCLAGKVPELRSSWWEPVQPSHGDQHRGSKCPGIPGLGPSELSPVPQGTARPAQPWGSRVPSRGAGPCPGLGTVSAGCSQRGRRCPCPGARLRSSGVHQEQAADSEAVPDNNQPDTKPITNYF